MKNLSIKNFLIILLVPILFLILSVFTLSDYGINWDSPKHFIRGQSYLHFILTGKKDFCDLPPPSMLSGAPDYVDYNVNPVVCDRNRTNDANIRRSYFQSDFYTFDYFMIKHEHTHPEVNDLLSAFTNYIFYQKLGLLGDIESYHLFIVLVTFALVITVAFWTYRYFGVFSSLVASVSLSLYPLVFSESHFNIKDPVLMSFFGLAIFSFWLGFSNKKPFLIIVSAIFAGFALGTKFNVIFLPFILGPWAIFDLYLHYKKGKSLINLIGGFRVCATLFAYPLIMFSILYVFSPYLWQDPVGHFMQIVNYYKNIGAGTPEEQVKYVFWGWNTYPIVWIFYSTPLPILFLSIVGVIYSVFLILRKKSEIAFLILLWFLVPIIRVVWPRANIYGGVRQIMEFVPAMAILAGIGAYFLKERPFLITTTRKTPHLFIALLIFSSLVFVFWEMVTIHPNQNVYFSQLVGGLRGAYEVKIPSWGNSYGNVYLQGINWLNEHAEPNAKLALAANYISSIPRLKLREDISLDNNYWSGPSQAGEYVMEMYYDWPLIFRYKYAYDDTFLIPVYQVEVEGVPLLKIWKNDLEYTKSGFENEVLIKPKSVVLVSNKSGSDGIKKLKIDFDDKVSLTRLIIKHSIDNCQEQDDLGFIETSQDDKIWKREPGPLVDPETPKNWMGQDKNTFVFMFPARPVLSMVLDLDVSNPCILKDYKITVTGLPKSL